MKPVIISPPKPIVILPEQQQWDRNIETPENWKNLITYVLENRTSKNYERSRAVNRIKNGFHTHTSHIAEPYTLPHLAGLNNQQKIGAQKMAAICATRTKTQHRDHVGGLGESMARLHYRTYRRLPQQKNTLTVLVNQLASFDQTNLCDMLAVIIKRCGNQGVAVNYYNITNMVLHWGDGLTQNSLVVRREIIKDFYSLTLENLRQGARP